MPITIRKYQSTDKEQLIRIMNNFQDYIVSIDDMHLTRRMAGYGKVYVKQTLKELKENNGVMYIAENEQKTIIGIVSGIIEKPSKIYKYECVPVKSGRLTELYLEPDYRGKKYGKLLMKTIESYFIKQKCTVVFIEVFGPNRNAHKFYENSGYRDRDQNMIKVLLRSSK